MSLTVVTVRGDVLINCREFDRSTTLVHIVAPWQQVLTSEGDEVLLTNSVAEAAGASEELTLTSICMDFAAWSCTSEGASKELKHAYIKGTFTHWEDCNDVRFVLWALHAATRTYTSEEDGCLFVGYLRTLCVSAKSRSWLRPLHPFLCNLCIVFDYSFFAEHSSDVQGLTVAYTCDDFVEFRKNCFPSAASARKVKLLLELIDDRLMDGVEEVLPSPTYIKCYVRR